MIDHSKWLCSMFLGALFLTSCSIWSEMTEDAAKATAAIEAEFGGEVALGWETENGEIIHINVHFTKPNEDLVIDAALKARLQEIVAVSFRRPVPEVNVSI
jgi:hypothetical protein